MLILSLDTTGSILSLALLEEEKVLAEQNEPLERGQAEFLMPLIQTLMTKTGKEMADLDAVAVCTGPGSFTGVRIGLAGARAFGLALDIPVWGVTAFEAACLDQKEPCVVALDTKRDDYYVAFMDEKGDFKQEPSVMTAEDLRSYLPFKAIGDGALNLSSKIGCSIARPRFSSSVAVGKLAFKRRSGQPVPFYLRDADVTL